LNLADRFALPDPNWVIGKNALLTVVAKREGDRTVLQPVSRRIPYQWQDGYYQDRDDQPFLLLHNSGGGFIEGDTAHLQISAEAGARFLMTTTAANKFYKCDQGGSCADVMDIELADDCLFEYLPDEAIPYARSRASRSLRVSAQPTSRVFLSDVISAGRINYRDGESFAFTSFRSECELRVGPRRAWLDRLIAETPEQIGDLAALWGGYRHMGTIVCHAPDLPTGIEDVVHAAFDRTPDVKAGVTRLENIICVRMLGREAWEVHETVYEVWAALRPMLAGKQARRINKP
jgi:urease accessory protein